MKRGRLRSSRSKNTFNNVKEKYLKNPLIQFRNFMNVAESTVSSR
jgi:hypothetical protein